MARNQHPQNGGQATQNQNNAMSDDPKDGSRRPTRSAGAGKPEAQNVPEEQRTPDPEDFGKRG